MRRNLKLQNILHL